jgi:hypothetical protein
MNRQRAEASIRRATLESIDKTLEHLAYGRGRDNYHSDY